MALRDTPAKQALVAELMADPAFRAMLEPDPDDGVRYTMPVGLKDTFGDLMEAVRGLPHVNVIVFDDGELDGVMHVRTDDSEPSRGHQDVDPDASVGLVVAFVRAMGEVDLRAVHRQIDLHPVG